MIDKDFQIVKIAIESAVDTISKVFDSFTIKCAKRKLEALKENPTKENARIVINDLETILNKM